MRLLLDTAVLGEVCHPRKYADVRSWMARAVFHHEVLISEVADYELRRELLRIESHRSLDRLDELTRELTYVPMATSLGARLQSSGRLFDAEGRSQRHPTRLTATS